MTYDFTTLGALLGLAIAITIATMIGGGKAGNIISPNPNTIAAAEAFQVDLTALMLRNIIPALCAMVVTILLIGTGTIAGIIAGATVLDSLPHGSFFHATGGSVNMRIKKRMKLIPYEACIGLTSTIVAVIVYLVRR